MKTLCINSLIITLSLLIPYSLTASDHGRVQAPFTIPTLNKQPDYNNAQLPLCSGYERASDATKLSIITEKLSAYMQCPYIAKYDHEEQYKLIKMHFTAQHKIDELSRSAYKGNKRLDKFNLANNKPLTPLMMHQFILIKKLYDLQKYKEAAHQKFLEKQKNLHA